MQLATRRKGVMSDKDNPQDVIEAYRKRQHRSQRAPWLIVAAAVLLVVGAGFIIFWLLGSGTPSFSLFATDTPTPTATATNTATPTNTSTPTNTPTITITPTETTTPTPEGPFVYEVVEGDNLFAIAQRFEVDLFVLIAINNLDPNNPIIDIGDQLTIPGPDTELPTATPLPANIRRGTIIEYYVLSGDSIAIIAARFFSTEDAIIEENVLENPNDIRIGQLLLIPVNLVTPIPTNTPQLGTPTPTAST